MNERIKKLIEQATDIVEIVNPESGITHHREFFDKEKFAELIVRECANVANQHMEHNEGTDYNVGGKIKQHFGVEESNTFY
jgi:hypothetical protein